MPFPTYAVSTELDAVNQILSSVGQAPVTTLDLRNPEVAIVLNTLREINKMVQSEGWIFNTEHHYEFTPNSNKEIVIPSNVLALDVSPEYRNEFDTVRRGGKLYDRQNHSYQWEGPVTCDVTWFFDFTEVPPPIQAYITARAARMSATKLIGDGEINKLLIEQEQLTRATALEYECTQGDYSMFGYKDGQNYYTSYQPFNALSR